MKTLKAIAMAAAMSACAFSAQAQSISKEFDSIYDPASKMVRENASLVYGSGITPIWEGSDSFVYSTNEESGKTYYAVDVRKGIQSAISAEEFESRSGNDHRRRDGRFWGRPGLEPVASPDGKMELVYRDNNIWVRNAGDDKSLRQLSFDGTDQDSYTQAYWSPDSRKIAAYRNEVIKERQIMLRMSRPETQVQPEYRWIDYAKPGDALPQKTPALFDVERMVRLEFDTTPYSDQYDLFHGTWSPDSKYFTFEYNKRGHQLYQLVAVDAASGENRILAEEKTDTFVYYNELYRYYYDDGRTILWMSERDDWRHLYMIDAEDCSIRQITKGEWNVREIYKVDEENGFILMNVNGYPTNKGEDPYNKHLVRLDIGSGRISDLTPENANHRITFNSDFSAFVDSYSRPDFPGATVLRKSDGTKVMDLQKADVSKLLEKGFTMPAVFSAKGRDGKTDIWGTIFFPYNYDKNKKYPVVEYIYAGPHDNHVVKDFAVYTRNAQLQELGFIVVTIDGMGTDNRSKSFQDVAFRNLKDAGFPDRILWM